MVVEDILFGDKEDPQRIEAFKAENNLQAKYGENWDIKNVFKDIDKMYEEDEKEPKEAIEIIKPAKEKRLEVEEINWNNLQEMLTRFAIYQGSEQIYNLEFGVDVVRLEGKEIMDYNIFILRFFEKKGVMLPAFRGIKSEWARLISFWRKEKGMILQEKQEEMSEVQEAKETIINYIENCSIVDGYVVKEGVICLKEDIIFVPTRIIKRILKRSSLHISMRKLAYVLDDYLVSGSIPLRVQNKSERFWKFKKEDFNIEESKKVELVKEEDQDKEDGTLT